LIRCRCGNAPRSGDEHEGYVTRAEHDVLARRQPPLGRTEATRAALIPLRIAPGLGQRSLVMKRMTMNADLRSLGARLVGRWTTEATHPGLPGVILTGYSEIEWLEGERFLIDRSHHDHPDVPDAISIIGDTDGLQMHYFDSRGVYRIYETSVTDEGWEIAMDANAPFWQRMTFFFEDDEQTIAGHGKLSHDGVHWEDDLQIMYRR
jgi:hypothetical protein